MGKTNQLGVLADVFTSDASNNVGIGGSPSGSYKLEVTGTAKVSSTLLVSGAATFGSSVTVVFDSGITFGSRGAIKQDASFNYIWSTNNLLNAMQLSPLGGLTLGGSATTGIDLSSGTFSYSLDIANNQFIRQKNNAGTLCLLLGMSSDNSVYLRGSNSVVLQPNNGLSAMTLTSAGWVYIPSITDGAGSYALKWRSGGLLSFDTSSARYKDNIRDSSYGLSDVLKLRSAMFEYKKDVRTDIGLIAEEVYEVIPELVTLNEDGLPDAVSYDRFVSVLIKSIQELNQQNQDLKSRLDKAGL